MTITYIGLKMFHRDFKIEVRQDKVSCDVTFQSERDLLGHIEVNIVGIIAHLYGGPREVLGLVKEEALERIAPTLQSYYLASRMRGREADIA